MDRQECVISKIGQLFFNLYKQNKQQKWEFQSNKQINETLSVVFYSSPIRNKEQKKQIKMPGFSFLYYLFDNPYFLYNNFTPSITKKKNVYDQSVLPPVKHE